MARSYDSIAPVYDVLARLVFGRAQVAAQQWLLRWLRPGMRLLVIGGGTGWILEAIARQVPEGLTIGYVDASGRMLAIARRRQCGQCTIRFVQAVADAYKPDGQYDAVLTGFLFDNLTTAAATALVQQLRAHLRPGGLWLNADFVCHRWWHAAMLRLMYLFFRLLCGVATHKLPDIDGIMALYGWRAEERRSFYGGFIESAVYSAMG